MTGWGASNVSRGLGTRKRVPMFGKPHTLSTLLARRYALDPLHLEVTSRMRASLPQSDFEGVRP